MSYRVLDKVTISGGHIRHALGYPGKVDTWSHLIGYVAQVLPAGAFDDSLTAYWNHISGKFDLSTPPNVYLGDEVGIALYGENTGSAWQSMYMSISIFSPSGKEYFTSSVAHDVYPGAVMEFDATEIANEAGGWTAEATLYGEVI